MDLISWPFCFSFEEYLERLKHRTTFPPMDSHDQRTILARHHFHANIQHTIVRLIRETPV